MMRFGTAAIACQLQYGRRSYVASLSCKRCWCDLSIDSKQKL